MNAKIGSAITKQDWGFVLPATIDLALWSLPAAIGAKMMSVAQKRLQLAIRSQLTKYYQTVKLFYTVCGLGSAARLQLFVFT